MEEDEANKESDVDVKLKVKQIKLYIMSRYEIKLLITFRSQNKNVPFFQLQITTVSLAEEIVLSLPDVEMWLPTLKEHSILPCLLDSVKIWLEVSASSCLNV